ncbi:hypothetical protein [Roseateles sp. L2-2]|jgi:hypothetical protein|uniref:hypothetical protein n=1 Tax=Roseateles TaxID=93681 RepID=UPI003D35BB08
MTVELTDLKSEFAGVRSEIGLLRTELKQEIAGLRGDIADWRGEMAQMRNSLVLWIVGGQVASITLMFGMIKFIHP